MKKFKFKLGNLLLSLDDFFDKHHIYFNLFVKAENKNNHVNFLARHGYNLIFDSENNIKYK